MTDYSANNKTVSDEIRYENNRTYQNNVIVVSFSFFIREATKCILPHPPESFHQSNIACFEVPALSFAARTEKPYISKHIADMMSNIDNLIHVVPLLEQVEDGLNDSLG